MSYLSVLVAGSSPRACHGYTDFLLVQLKRYSKGRLHHCCVFLGTRKELAKLILGLEGAVSQCPEMSVWGRWHVGLLKRLPSVIAIHFIYRSFCWLLTSSFPSWDCLWFGGLVHLKGIDLVFLPVFH